MPQARHPLKDAAESTQKSLARVGHRADDNPVFVRGKALRADTLLGLCSDPRASDAISIVRVANR
jgi:hypothetical protein